MGKPVTPGNVRAILVRNNFRAATAKRYGFYIQVEPYGLIVLWVKDRPGEGVAPQPQRCEALFRIREALLPTYGAQLSGKHHTDGYPIAVLVSERATTETSNKTSTETTTPTTAHA